MTEFKKCSHNKLMFAEEGRTIVCDECDSYWRINGKIYGLKLSGSPRISPDYYCNQLHKWAGIVSEHDENFENMYRQLSIRIEKSCLLDRLIYCGEELRKEPCPKHKGRWSGIYFNEECECVGSCGCLTGWLPNK